MPKFRKKPVVIDAEQFMWPDDKPVPAEPREMFMQYPVQAGPDGAFLLIPTLEGDMTVSPGDWVITGVKGEQYPCKPDIFEATYEPA